MEVFFDYRAETQSGESDDWVRIREEDAVEPEDDALSKVLDVPAVTCVKQYPSDYPIVCLIPADRGRPMRDVYHKYSDLFILVFMNRERDERIVSSKEMPISAAYDLICKYKNTRFPLLVRLLSRTGAEFYVQKHWRA